MYLKIKNKITKIKRNRMVFVNTDMEQVSKTTNLLENVAPDCIMFL